MTIKKKENRYSVKLDTARSQPSSNKNKETARKQGNSGGVGEKPLKLGATK